MPKKAAPIPMDFIERRIYYVRGQKVMLDYDLAELYGVPTYRLTEAVRRNQERFPADFCFGLSFQEVRNLRSHFAISSLEDIEITGESDTDVNTTTENWGGRRRLPYVFTEQGVAMLSSVLNSPRAIASISKL